ncbi:ATP-binding cassette domain-containing protein [Microbacterium sp.]|uniref:ABC transporter ATP-binding protein n=1 Tax=Microbacterium sp. TaxID=51671 RepID=UPI001AC6B10D|nr:ATP-binding cassette domain-containing protein [Microbacterium sp.]MBN9156592.1 ATP-binding cassette domain-containing protein [Microbacterium sp.]MBS1899963.1 ATP-binding cassette domain-containing protein [Actinomycetota bacterium]
MIEFRSVTKTFPDGTRAVDDFSLVIPARQTTVLVGSSGSGKTTLLRMINRMVEPTSGAVEIDGVSVLDGDPVALRRRIGYVMQNSGLLPHFSVIDNIATVLRLNGVPRREAHERARELLDTVGLDQALAERYPSQLSGGQQQRVGVARGLAADPNILLMDEPFGAVDPIVRTELQQELLRLQRELGKTVVFVTHDIDEALLLGDRIVILDRAARIVQQGTPDEILTAPADEFVAAFIGADRGRRALHLKQTPHGTVVVDADGRAQGTLVQSPADLLDAHPPRATDEVD